MDLIRAVAGEVAREIGDKSREFYEFVLPPVDVSISGQVLTVEMDMAGFGKDDIELSVAGDILSVKASKPDIENGKGFVFRQRPRIIDKRVRLPVRVGDQGAESARLDNGVLTITIKIPKRGTDIPIQ